MFVGLAAVASSNAVNSCTFNRKTRYVPAGRCGRPRPQRALFRLRSKGCFKRECQAYHLLGI